VIKGAVAVALAFTAARVSAHPFHESQTEIDYREACSCLEITLRVKPEEIEAALIRGDVPRLPLEHSRMRERLQEYVLQRFVLADSQGRVLSLQWVGVEVDSLGAWIYLQSPALQLPVQLRNDVLLEQEAEQVNRVLFRAAGSKQSLQFSRESPRLQWLDATTAVR
jgi:hypothetical protein